jgi:hypothetical protein
MDPLYLLLHNPPETGKVKVIGVYSTETLAEDAMDRARQLPGFAEEADGFSITRIQVDKDQWTRGFVRL